MILSSSKSFLFLHIYKVAGSSIRRALMPYADKRIVMGQTLNYLLKKTRLREITNPIYSYHPRLRDVREALGRARFNSLYRFSFVRNPWDWQVSLYHYALQSPRHPQYELFKSFTGFDQYLEWRVEHDLKLQSDFLCDEQGETMVDRLGHYESLGEDFARICADIGISCKLPYINKSDRQAYTSYYNEKSRRIVADAFAADIEKFGYRY